MRVLWLLSFLSLFEDKEHLYVLNLVEVDIRLLKNYIAVMATAKDIFLSMERGGYGDDKTKTMTRNSEETDASGTTQKSSVSPNVFCVKKATATVPDSELSMFGLGLPSAKELAKKLRGQPCGRKPKRKSAPEQEVDPLHNPVAESSTAPKRPKTQASLEIPKCIAEFAEQAKQIKQAVVEKKKLEKSLVYLPEAAQPTKLGQPKVGALAEFSCGMCDIRVSSTDMLVEHFRTVHGVGELIKVEGVSKNTNKSHEDDLIGRDDYVTCGFCGKEERSTKALMIHFVLMHPASSTMIAEDKKPAEKFFGSGDFVCGLCGIRKNKDVELMDHHRVAHPVFPPPFGEKLSQKDAPTAKKRKQNLMKIKESAVTFKEGLVRLPQVNV